MAKTYGTVTTFTAGSVLTAAQMNVAGGAVNNLVVPAAARVTRTTTQSVANSTLAALNFNSTVFDTDSMVGATTTYVTVNTPGLYIVTAEVGWGAVIAGGRGIFLSVNPTLSGSGDSTTITASTRIGSTFLTGVGSTTTQTSISVSSVYNFSAGDRLAVGLLQVSGGTLSTDNADGTHLALTWIGRTS